MTASRKASRSEQPAVDVWARRMAKEAGQCPWYFSSELRAKRDKRFQRWLKALISEQRDALP